MDCAKTTKLDKELCKEWQAKDECDLDIGLGL